MTPWTIAINNLTAEPPPPPCEMDTCKLCGKPLLKTAMGLKRQFCDDRCKGYYFYALKIKTKRKLTQPITPPVRVKSCAVCGQPVPEGQRKFCGKVCAQDSRNAVKRASRAL